MTDSGEEHAVLSRRHLCSEDMPEMVKIAVACSQLSDSDALASGPAKSPVGLQFGVSH